MDNPFDAPPAPEAPARARRRVDLSELPRVVAVALPASIAASAFRVGLQRASFELPAGVALPLFGVLGVGGLILAVSRRWEVLWAASLVLPFFALSIDLPEVPPAVMAQVRSTGGTLLGYATLDAFALWLWLDGPRRPGVPVGAFLGIQGLRSQLLALTTQLLIPGVLLSAAVALLPIAATRRRTGWFRASFDGIGPDFWIGAWAPVLCWGTWLLCVGGWSLDRGVVWQALLDGRVVPVGVDLAGDVASSVVYGVLFAVAAAVFDARRPGTPAA